MESLLVLSKGGEEAGTDYEVTVLENCRFMTLAGRRFVLVPKEVSLASESSALSFGRQGSVCRPRTSWDRMQLKVRSCSSVRQCLHTKDLMLNINPQVP